MPSNLTRFFFGFGCFTPILGFVLLGYLFSNRSFAGGVVALVICLVVMIFLFGFGSQLEQKQKAKQLEFMDTFVPDEFDSQRNKSFTSYDLLTKIAIDELQKKVHFWMPDPELVGDVKKAYAKMPYIIHTYNFSELLAVNLKENYRRTDSVHRDTHFTHFVLNKLKEDDMRKSSTAKPPVDKVSSMDLEVVVDDTTAPSHLIRFYHAPYIYIQKDSPEYIAYSRERQEWFAKLKVIIEQQNETSVETEQPTAIIETPPIPEPAEEDLAARTQIVVDVDTKQYSLQLHEETEVQPKANPEVIPEDKRAETDQDKVEKPLSYFEQIVEKNKRQLRGDSTDE